MPETTEDVELRSSATENASSPTAANDDNRFSAAEEALVTDANGHAEKSGALSAPAQPSRQMGNLAWNLVLSAVLGSYCMVTYDNTVIANIRPQIIYKLGEIEKLPLLSTAYALAATSSNLLWGQLYRQANIKILFVSAVILFEAGQALCGAAPNMDALIVGRAIAGFGGAGMYQGTINIITFLSTPQERPKYLGFLGLIYALGSLLGPIVGGAFANSKESWRWAFYLCLFVGAVAAPVLLFLLPAVQPKPNVKLLDRILQVDYLGFIIIAGAVTTFVMGLSLGGSTWAWSSGRTIGVLVGSGCLWILFVVQQAVCLLTTPENRLFPVQLLRSWEMWILFAQTATSMGSIILTLYFIPIFFQFVRNSSALGAGVKLLPFIGTLAFGTILNGIIMGKFALYMPWYFVGGILVLVGGILLHLVDLSTSTPHILGVSVLVSFGGSIYAQTSFSVAQNKTEPSLIPAATAFIGIAQLGGINLCLTISNSIFLNRATNKIAAILPNQPRQDIVNAVSGAGSSFFESLSRSLREQVLSQVVAAIQEVYYMVIAAGALSVVLSVLMKRERLKLPGATKK